MKDSEFDRWLKLFNDHGEHNKPLCDAAAFAHDAMRLSIASARTLKVENDTTVTPEDLALAVVLYDRTVDEMRWRKSDHVLEEMREEYEQMKLEMKLERERQ